MSALTWVGFVVAAAVGAPARYLVDGFVGERTGGAFPWGTFVVNATGSFILGVLTGLALYHGFPKAPRLVLGTGFCGAYTTFSTFTFETVRLIEEGAGAHALLNIVVTVTVCAVAAAGGVVLAGV